MIFDRYYKNFIGWRLGSGVWVGWAGGFSRAASWFMLCGLFGDGLCEFIAMFGLCFDIKLAGVR